MHDATFGKALLALTCMTLSSVSLGAQTLTIATVNNSDMIRMQKLSKTFEAEHPDIKLNWVVLEENVLRQRLTTDIATQGGQFDVLTIGMYEAALWGAKGWLEPMKDLPASYALDDVFPSVREGLSVKGTLYALPFYAESSITYYRTDLFKDAGLTMPERPTWEQIGEFAAKLNKPGQEQYGICLRGKAGWGENMALISTVANAYGARWFDEKWQPEFNGPEWKNALNFYVDTMKKSGPPGRRATVSMKTSRCSTAANARSGSMPASPDRSSPTSPRARSPITSASPMRRIRSLTRARRGCTHGRWPFRPVPRPRTRRKPSAPGPRPGIRRSGRAKDGIANVPPGTRASTYSEAYMSAAPFAKVTLESLKAADPGKPGARPVPYIGIQLVTIPEFQGIGTQVGKSFSAALIGQTTVDQALAAAQQTTEREMKRAGYPK